MRTITGIMVAVLLVGTGDASATLMQEGEVVSYVFAGAGDFTTFTMDAPLPHDFVLTDIEVLTTTGTTWDDHVYIYENQGGEMRALLNLGDRSFRSGIPFAAGSRIHVEASGVTLYGMTLIGYCPLPPSGTAAAISNVGLITLGVLTLAAGGHVLRKREVVA